MACPTKKVIHDFGVINRGLHRAKMACGSNRAFSRACQLAITACGDAAKILAGHAVKHRKLLRQVRRAARVAQQQSRRKQ